MAQHGPAQLDPSDRFQLGDGGARFAGAAVILGFIALMVGLLLGAFFAEGVARFFFSYLIAFAMVLSLSLGAMFLVLILHLTRAGWGVVIRRPAEAMASAFPVLAVLFLPILATVLLGSGLIYRWVPMSTGVIEAGHHITDNSPAHNETPIEGASQYDAATSLAPTTEQGEAAQGEAGAKVGPGHGAVQGLDTEAYYVEGKWPYLSWWFFTLRWIVYFAAWLVIGRWYWRHSVAQDASGEVGHTTAMEGRAAPALLVFAITITFAAFDLLMTLSPAWYSTIFGVYYFTGGTLGALALLILLLAKLQDTGRLGRTVTVEHYHDLGKLLFGFVFFWGYIAFSQYMLLWYASIPETAYWFDARGITTAAGGFNHGTVLGVVLLFGHFILPFVGLMSRHVKRRRPLLVAWAAWLLVMHYLDLYWLAMPELTGEFFSVGLLIDATVLLGVLGIWLGAVLHRLGGISLAPTRDPRLDESLAFENI